MTPRDFGYLLDRYELQIKREDHRIGEVIAMLYNTNRDSEKDPNGLRWTDFFPVWKEEPEEQTDDDMFALMQLVTTKLNEGFEPST